MKTKIIISLLLAISTLFLSAGCAKAPVDGKENFTVEDRRN